jgi:DNA polymerase-1
MANNDTLFLIDGSNYLYRAFHALPPLSNSQGIPTGAVYGITNMLKSLLVEYQPQYAAVVFDAKEKTFREELYPDYKANRAAMPDDLVAQISLTHEIVQALGLPLLMVSGVEADDVIGTLAKQAEATGMSTVIFTGDKDFTQLVNDTIILIDSMKQTRLDVPGVIAKFGIPPELMLDYLCLIGDSVDNIPGVDKVGPKTAVKWLTTYGSLAQITAAADNIKGKVGENLRTALPYLPLTRQLLTIRCDVPLAYTPQQLQVKPYDINKLRQLFTQLEFKKWLAALPAEEISVTESSQTVIETIAPVTAKIAKPSYHTILTLAAFEDWLKRLPTAPLLAIDTETTSLDYLEAEIVGISLAVQAGEAVYVPLAHDYLGVPTQLPRDQVLAALKPLLENPQYQKVGHHLKYDAHVFANHGIELQGIAFDTLLESYVLNSTATSHSLDTLASHYLQIKTITFEEVAGKGKHQLTFNQVHIDKATSYAAEDADITLQLHQKLWPQLQQLPQVKQIFTDVEIPLIPVLKRLERNGVLIDATQLHEHSTLLAQRLQTLEQSAYELAGIEFNLNSPKQLQTILFERFQLPVLQKTPHHEPSTAVEVLEELALDYPLPQLILEYRRLSKLKSTYTDALPRQINPRTGRIHTSYHQAVVATGRLSSSQPNLQNIPIRTPEGRRIRQAFIASPGYRLLAADYSQIELRIMAHLSGDQGLLAAFASEQDIHRHTAAEIFAVPLATVTTEQRRQAKAINFGLMYGMQAFGLAKQLGISRQEAQTYIETYFARYPAVKIYLEQIRNQTRQSGYVETVFGRRLFIPDIHSRNPQRRQYAERSAINAPMQGTAADLIKMAMLKIDHWIQTQHPDIKMIMQVHDELVFEVAEATLAEAQAVIITAMSQVAQLKVPLVVDVGIGMNWDEAH